MSAKTKIVVFHKKELIYTGLFTVLGILLITLLIMMFMPNQADSNLESGDAANKAAMETSASYIPGIYTTELVLGGQSVSVNVVVGKNTISSIELINLSDATATMYPLLAPTFDTICEQIYATQSLDGISYPSESKYTSLVLLEAIHNSLEKASPTPSADPSK